MTTTNTTSGKGGNPTPQQLDRLRASLKAAEVAKVVARLIPARHAETYGKIRDERSKDDRIISSRQ